MPGLMMACVEEVYERVEPAFVNATPTLVKELETAMCNSDHIFAIVKPSLSGKYAWETWFLETGPARSTHSRSWTG
jgi:hypothetical protein